MSIYIALLQEQDAEDLFQFECENRTFFEKILPSRGKDYYHFKYFRMRHSELLKEQDDNTSFFYLIKNNLDDIVGRINLVDIDKNKRKAHLGYRVGESFTRKGIADKAVKLLLQEAPKLNIREIHAKTTSNNIASQKVLEKNCFKQIFINDEEEIEFNGQILKLIRYIWN